MTFDEGSDISSGRTSRRGRNTAIGVGGGGLGILAIVLIGQLLGVDLSGLIGTGTDPGTGGGGDDSSLEQCQTGEDANENLDCRMKAAAASLEEYWDATIEGATPTQIVLFTGGVQTGCGGASSAVGPFYCPPDQTIYVDTAFFDQLQQFGSSAGPLAQLYVVGHEWGHHIQNISGIMDQANLQTTGPASDGVRLELQADCFAGAWIADAPFLEEPTDAQITDALSAAAAVGDDNIQEATQGQVQPETWTHGASESRQKWFLAGFRGGASACDTFGASAGDL